MQVKKNRKHYFSWIILVSIAFLGGLFFTISFLLPYESQKIWLDGFAADGDVESFTQSVYSSLRIAAGSLAIISITSVALLIVFKDKARVLIGSISNYFDKFVRRFVIDIKGLVSWIIPQKADLISLTILGIIVAFGVFYRYAYLWRPMGHDEAYTFMAFASRGLRTVITDYHLPNNHVFHSILVNLAYELFGDSPAVIRLPAFLAGILIIPATYIVARIFAGINIALVSSSIIAALPVLIDYSTTARGYTTITLLALLMLAIGAYVKDNKNLLGWFLIVLFSSLGLYTNPTMIYPVGMVFTWLFFSKFIGDIDQDYGKGYVVYLLVSFTSIFIISGLFYSPIIASSGLQSIFGNDVVEALNWQDFSQSVPVRVRNTWAEWNRDLPSWVSAISLFGLGASFFVPKQGKRQRTLLSLAGVLWIGTALLVQRVAPWPRIWLFLMPLFVIWITAGIIGLFELIFRQAPRGEFLLRALVVIMISGPLILGLVRNYPQFDQKLHSKGAVEEVADFLHEEIQAKDVVVVTSPDTVVLKYYLRRLGLSKDLTELSKGKSFNRAIVVVNQAYEQNLEYVLDRRSFLDDVDLNSAEEIYSSKRFTLYQLSGD